MRAVTSGLPTLYFEIGDLEYSIEVESYSPPTPDTRDEPGDGGECELASFVTISVNGVDVGNTTYNVFVMDAAGYWGVQSHPMTKDEAERRIYDQAMEKCGYMDPPEPDYDDYDDWSPDLEEYDDEPL